MDREDGEVGIGATLGDNIQRFDNFEDHLGVGFEFYRRCDV